MNDEEKKINTTSVSDEEQLQYDDMELIDEDNDKIIIVDMKMC